MTAPDRPLTFIVRLFPVAGGRFRGTVEIVRTGLKYAVRDEDGRLRGSGGEGLCACPLQRSASQLERGTTASSDGST
jgi:hypothetical protein